MNPVKPGDPRRQATNDLIPQAHPEPVAYIEFIEPTRCIRQLDVRDPKYNLNRAIRIPDLATLLSQTNAPKEYRSEALALLVAEANQVARDLALPEKLPISVSDVAEAYISPPRLAKSAGAIGTIATSNYLYLVSEGNKFSPTGQTKPGA